MAQKLNQAHAQDYVCLVYLWLKLAQVPMPNQMTIVSEPKKLKPVFS